MKREVLIEKIINLCLVIKVFDNCVNENEIKHTVALLLEEEGFIKDLYSNILRNAKRYKIANTEKVTDILIELDKIRLELLKEESVHKP